MTWLRELNGCSELKAFLQHTSICVLVSKPDGTILWANHAFLEWSGYTLGELEKFGWQQISVPGEALIRDMHIADNWDAYSPIYTVQKQYHRKNQTASWGVLTAMRFPPMGNIEFCVCTWVPHEDATNAALGAAMKAIGEAEAASEQLGKAFDVFSRITEEQRFIMTSVQLAQKYPKIAWAILIMCFGLFGLNNAIEILRTVQLVPQAMDHASKQSSP